MHKMTHFKTSLTLLVLLLISFNSQAEFSFDRGERDSNRHPNVGWIAAFDKSGKRLGNYCSGTLIDKKTFLTASHCTIAIHDNRVGDPKYKGFRVYVGFTEDFLLVGQSIDDISDKSKVFLVTSVHTNPDYDFFWMSPQPDRADIAVVFLKKDPPIAKAQLPELAELDQLKANGLINNINFEAVGYGATDVVIPNDYDGGPWNWFETGQYRYVGYPAYNALHPGYMILSMSFETGNSGPCYGDSGGPIFDGDTGKLVAITVAGDVMCKAMTAPLRLDTVGARAFLSQHGVTLP
jgi:hypothetical protein